MIRRHYFHEVKIGEEFRYVMDRRLGGTPTVWRKTTKSRAVMVRQGKILIAPLTTDAFFGARQTVEIIDK